MTRSSAKPDIAAELKRTSRAQADAADPQASVWVSANAGTGKTHVLTMRVLRLMLAGTPPEKILCLTYTKAAAAEMAKRVFGDLAKWVTASNDALDKALVTLIERQPTDDERSRARTLFARAIETPGGLKVQTIHAFSERLLQRFPLEAGVPPGFSILDDETANELRREAIDSVLTTATRDKTGPLGKALTTAIAYAAEDQFDDVLASALGYRDWLDTIPRLEFGKKDVGKKTGFDALEAMLKQHTAVRPAATPDTIADEMASLLTDADLKRLAEILRGGGKTDAANAEKIDRAAKAASPAARTDALRGYFLTEKGEPKKSLMTKALKDEHSDVDAQVSRAQDRFLVLSEELSGANLTTATLALSRLADAVLQRYTAAKGRRAALDFDDLIKRTANLLAARGQTGWVLYKLDGGLDHILVDESQDTSPEQWRIVGALAEEFFSGSGASEDVRTLFAVGDEKQSIYSFQGAAPKMFAAMGDDFAGRAGEAGIPWRRIPLNVSFRTVEPVLEAVDAVFADDAKTPGVAAGGGAIRHVAARVGRAGAVEIWPTETHDDNPDADAWSPLEETPPTSPVVRVANRIADTIKGWLDTGERLPAEDRLVNPGDILVLVRKRRPFAEPMVAALKARGIPVAGADRIALMDQIAVQDLAALGSFLILPEDDLALATVLKSPFFGLDDAALLAIAHGRKGTLWKALLDHAEDSALLSVAAATLKRWRKAADFTPPFEFFASLLDKDGGREKLLARLGPDAADPIDEFLNLALTYDDSAPASLTGFITWLKGAKLEIKRDMEHGRNEVRVMTVHGAKGLEAPIVFLPDTCSASSGGGVRGGPLKLADLPRPPATPEPFVWPVKSTTGLAPIVAARARIATAEKEELNRLLYVAMTRPRDRLYVCGFEGKKGRDAGCWYDTIADALDGSLTTVERPDGVKVRRLDCPQTVPPDKPRHELAAATASEALPAWAVEPARREPKLSVPLAPSRLAPYETDETGEPVAAPRPKEPLAEPVMLPPGAPADQNRFLRGTLTHALLEHLPSLDKGLWPKAAKAFVAKRGPGLTARTRDSIVAETLAVLTHADFAPLFGPDSQAEVPIVARLPRPRGQGPALELTGQIDRLAVVGTSVLIVDYKTNRPPPRVVEGVAAVYLFQLAAYRLAIREIYPGHRVRAALLWTDGAELMEIPEELLESYATKLWDLDTRNLDA